MSAMGKLGEMLRLLRGGTARIEALQQRIETLEEAQREAQRQLADRHKETAELFQAVMAKAADADLQYVRNTLAADIKRETGWLRDRLAALGSVLDAVASPADRAAGALAVSPATAAAEEAFYPALEQQFRGSREEILARLQPYHPWVERAPEGRIADLGCGRGEWLELLGQWGRKAVGIDSNGVLVAENEARGLMVMQADAIAWLAGQPSASLAAVSCFHVVEHLPIGVLLRLVEEAQRVLMPGGLLILETPNPENLSVAMLSFWLDPTHQRPLPPALLEFIVQHAGLAVEATLRLSPPPQEPPTQDPALKQLLMQGRDYAVIGRKQAA